MTMTAIGLSLAGKITSKTCGIAETTWNNLKISFLREEGSGLLQSSPLPRDEVTVCSSSGWPQVIFSGQRSSARACDLDCCNRPGKFMCKPDPRRFSLSYGGILVVRQGGTTSGEG